MIRTFNDAERLFEHVLEHLSTVLTPTDHADILERLCWACTDPDGHLQAVREQWLLGDDRRRIEIALSFQEIFPFRDHRDMEAVLQRIGQRWPDLRGRCDELVASRAHYEQR